MFSLSMINNSMACSVAVAGASPVFSPSKRRLSLACKQSPETLISEHELHLPGVPPPTTSAPSSTSPSLYRRRPLLGGSGLRFVFSDGSSASTNDPSSTSDAGTDTALKRKRPGRIHIPAVESADFASKSSRGDEEVEFDSGRYAVFSKRGRRRMELEDRYKVSPDGESDMAFFGVFDGHGGTAAVEFAANNLGKHIMGEIKEQKYEEAIRTGYLKTDAEFLERKESGGASCVSALIVNSDLIVSHAGDCRAVMSSAGAAEALTSDHRPSREDERIRIENLGGYLDYRHGALRLHGSLAVSRGIGDGHLKQWVTAEPETRVLRIKPEFEFLILASDGLWEKVSNQEAVDVARPLCLKSDQQSLLSACKKLVRLSVDRGSADDISVMIIALQDSI